MATCSTRVSSPWRNRAIARTRHACDCQESDLEYNRPLCNPPGGGEAGLTQYSAQAYPAPRLLQTLRDLGDNGVVASLRPRVATGDPEHPAFGYSAAMTSIFDRSKTLCACVACHAHSLSTTTGRSRAPSWR